MSLGWEEVTTLRLSGQLRATAVGVHTSRCLSAHRFPGFLGSADSARNDGLARWNTSRMYKLKRQALSLSCSRSSSRAGVPARVGAATTNFAYNNVNELTAPGPASYDKDAEPLTLRGASFKWDAGNRLIQ